MELKFIVLKNKIYQTKKDPQPVCNNSEYVAVFTFDKYWNGVAKTARFVCYGKNKKPVEMFDVPIVDGKCNIPPITIAGKVTLGVYGGDIISSNVVTLTFVEGPLTESAPQGAPSNSVYNKIMELFEKYYLRSATVKQNGELEFERGDGTTINAGKVDGITIIGEKAQSDWTETDENSPAYVKNKPILENEVKKDSENAVSSFAVYDELEKKLDTPEHEGVDGQALFYSAKGPHWKDIVYPEVIKVDDKLDETSENPVQNRAITAELKKKSEFSGSYNDLTDKPPAPTNVTYSLVKSAHNIILSGSDGSSSTVEDNNTVYNHPNSHPADMITGLADVAKSGSYNDLTDKPPAPTNVTYSLVKSAHNIILSGSDGSSSTVEDNNTVYNHPNSHPADMITGLADVAKSGSYNDLTDKPPAPTNVTYSLVKSAHNIILSGSDGNSSTVEDNDTIYANATPNSRGLMSAEDKKKLDGLMTDIGRTSVSVNLCDGEYEYGYFYDTGEVNDTFTPITVSFRTKNFIPVVGGSRLCQNNEYGASQSIQVVQYDAGKNIIGVRTQVEAEANRWTNNGITLNANTKYVRFGVYRTVEDLNTVKINLFYYDDRNEMWADPGNIFTYVPRLVVESAGEFVSISKIQSPLTGKKIVYDGDSIAETRLSYANNGGGYAKLIADRVGGSYENHAVGGARLTSCPADKSYHSVVDNLINLPKDGDLYCFEGGINDYWTPKVLGTFSKTDFSGTLDTNTICGALETVFRYALTNFVGKPICFVITHKIQSTANTKNANGDTFEDYRNAMVGICEKYSIPYYDAFSESGLNGWNDAQNTAYLTANTEATADGTHPNAEGYKRYYVPQLIALFERIMPLG